MEVHRCKSKFLPNKLIGSLASFTLKRRLTHAVKNRAMRVVALHRVLAVGRRLPRSPNLMVMVMVVKIN
jgi:hypothetical protein